MNDTFSHNGKKFEIRNYNDGNKILVKVFSDNKQVSLEYSADLDVAADFFLQHGEFILESLKQIAIDDIKRGLYIGGDI